MNAAPTKTAKAINTATENITAQTQNAAHSKPSKTINAKTIQ